MGRNSWLQEGGKYYAVYILETNDVIWGENIKRGGKKAKEDRERNRKKERKRENTLRSKRVKLWQNREEFRQIGHDRNK